MTRSHPPSLLKSLERCLVDECKPGPDEPLLLAVSGGADSMALLHGLHHHSKQRALRFHVASVNHGLRPEAQGEVELVRKSCEKLGVSFHPLTLELGSGGNQQARARRARYAALGACAEEHLGPGALIVTAHHADDRAETVLIRLLRGCSLEALGVLPPRDGRYLRPLIRTRKQSIEAHVARHEIPFVDDPSNFSTKYQRVRVRREVMPLLTTLSPNIVEHLNSIADEALRGGTIVGLGREQREQLRRALGAPGTAIDLPLRDGLRLFRS